MIGRRIIAKIFFIATLLVLSQRQDVATAQQPATFAPPDADAVPVQYSVPGPYLIEPPAADCSQPKPIFVAPPPTTWVQPAQPVEMVPLVPLPQSASPRPGALPGPMFGAPGMGATPGMFPPPAEAGSPSGPLEDIAPGGAIAPQFGLPAGPEALPGFANPIMVPAVDDHLAWEQIVDVVSDYFPIAREQQVRRSGEAWSEGRIETGLQAGAGWLEPFRHDSVGNFNRWESTFQTIRRSAVIRVIPDTNGYLVEVVVQKEIEDLPHPERATAGVSTFRHDGSLPTGRADTISRTLSSPRWLPLGRDPALEARMLADIHARLNGVTTASSPSIWP